jgi:hypothetical protein
LEPHRFDELDGWRQWLRRLQANRGRRKRLDRRRQPSTLLTDPPICPVPVMEQCMNEPTFDTLTRRAAQVVSRRGSLRALSGVALALGLTEPTTTAAKKGGKHGDRCQNQVSRCKTGLGDLCTSAFHTGNAQLACVEAFIQCCEPLRRCDTAQAFACAVRVVENLADPSAEPAVSGRGDRARGMATAPRHQERSTFHG